MKMNTFALKKFQLKSKIYIFYLKKIFPNEFFEPCLTAEDLEKLEKILNKMSIKIPHISNKN